MPTFEITSPSGKKYQVDAPDGATQAEVLDHVRQHESGGMLGDKVSGQNLSDLVTGTLRPTDDSRLRGFMLGLTKPLDNLAAALTSGGTVPTGQTNVITGNPIELGINPWGPGPTDLMGAADRWLSRVTGAPTVAEDNARNAQERAANSRTGYQTLGNIAGTLPVAALTGGPISQGAVSGALLSDADSIEGVAEDAALGGALGKAGDVIVGGLARAAKPYVSKGAELLRDAGVPMTLGQLAEQAGKGGGAIAQAVGSTVRGMEDRLAGLPVVGDIIRPAQQRGVDAYNRAIVNRTLAPVGIKLPDNVATGHEAIKFAGDALSDRYQQLLPSLKATIDRRFAADLKGAWNDIVALPDKVQEQFKNIIADTFVNRAQGFTISGADVKAAESKLGEYIRAFSPSNDGDQRLLGKALEKVQEGFRDLLARSNPSAADELSNINRGWAQLAVAEKAAARQGTKDGLFTPKQFAAEARMADNTVRRRATARGTRPDQPFAEAGADILSNPVPDSGTAGRLMAAGAAGGTIATNPALALKIGMGAMPYTTLGQRLLNSLFVGQRGSVATAAGDALQRARRIAPVFVVPAEKDQNN